MSRSRDKVKGTLPRQILSRKSKQSTQLKRTISPRHDVGRSKIIHEIEDDYGLSTLEKDKKIEIPTFGKKQSEQLVESIQRQPQSPVVVRTNFIELNKKISTRTEFNIKSKKELKSHSNYSSPYKIYTKTEPSNSLS